MYATSCWHTPSTTTSIASHSHGRIAHPHTRLRNDHASCFHPGIRDATRIHRYPGILAPRSTSAGAYRQRHWAPRPSSSCSSERPECPRYWCNFVRELEAVLNRTCAISLSYICVGVHAVRGKRAVCCIHFVEARACVVYTCTQVYAGQAQTRVNERHCVVTRMCIRPRPPAWPRLTPP
ncbi:hypothetical protein L227DRAFT_390679 [Lentinus tigrinus ALCF2SS1-6]|uniref:Uncharacterized protein n=1 Tax=Lentinus tigrinus ALCF2SS1-6 TaxID=1328759 RepID=A0A5C2SJW8_9APHY|nr:hypothetical protein L227DRAFT_390679 [Lentinus tigrinus ALCF2SS1-6]